MSSAILYLAIIAIWLCVLIPRWLKRDSARGAVIASDAAAPGDTPVTTRRTATARQTSRDDGDGAGRPTTAARPATTPTARWSAAPLSAEEARRRIMAGRRRLLGMLILLGDRGDRARGRRPGRHVGDHPALDHAHRVPAAAPRGGARRRGAGEARSRGGRARAGAGARGPRRGHGPAQRATPAEGTPIDTPTGGGGRGGPRRQVRRRPGPGRLRGLRPGLRARAGGQVHHLERGPRARPPRTTPTRSRACAPSATS